MLRSSLAATASIPLVGACASVGRPGEFANHLSRTPRQTAGPFYPDPLPLDVDNDLVVMSDQLTPAVGEVTHLWGSIRDTTGTPLRGAEVEIWQADSTGAYIHKESDGFDARDRQFQGFGRFETDAMGRYRFRTIKPGKYPERARHIHLLVRHRGKRLLTTQLYVRGDESNAEDFILNDIPTLAERDSVLIDFAPMPNSDVGELVAHADIFVGLTPDEPRRSSAR